MRPARLPVRRPSIEPVATVSTAPRLSIMERQAMVWLAPRATSYIIQSWTRPVVRAGIYRWPVGFTYHRWVVGRPLARAFFAPAYYYAGYAALGLAPPPANYQWIRYGPDLMLVNLSTGNVVDIRYGVFAQ